MGETYTSGGIRSRIGAEFLSLAAAPTFGAMALLTSIAGEGHANLLCLAGHGSWVGGMVPMYLLMSAFHLAPWLRLISNRRSGACARYDGARVSQVAL